MADRHARQTAEHLAISSQSVRFWKTRNKSSLGILDHEKTGDAIAHTIDKAKYNVLSPVRGGLFFVFFYSLFIEFETNTIRVSRIKLNN